MTYCCSWSVDFVFLNTSFTTEILRCTINKHIYIKGPVVLHLSAQQDYKFGG
jgi:hypothetical protein